MENEDKFQGIIDETIQNASQGLSRQVDVIILQDLKRMSECGVLEIQMTQPDFSGWDAKTIEVTQQCRLRFTGEETITAQKKALLEVKEFLDHIQPKVGEQAFNEIYSTVEQALNKT